MTPVRFRFRILQYYIINLSPDAPPRGGTYFQASVLGKTWSENHLGLMHHGTSGALGGKLTKKLNMKLRPLHNPLLLSAPAQLEDLGWGRGGFQGGGSGGGRGGRGTGGA